MTEFKDWNALITDVEELGGLACYKLSVLLLFYGVDRAGSNTNQGITDSLTRRGYAMQPRCIAGLDPETWVRIYKKDTVLGRVLDTVLDVSPNSNTDLRKLARKFERDENIKRLIKLAKTIAEE